MPPRYPFRSSAGRGKSGKGASTASQERVVSTSAPPLSTSCAGIAGRQAICNGSVLNPGVLSCVCIATKRAISPASVLRPPLQDSRVARARAPLNQEKRAKEKVVSRMCFLVHSPRSPPQTEGAMVVQGEEGYLQAVFCVILPV